MLNYYQLWILRVWNLYRIKIHEDFILKNNKRSSELLDLIHFDISGLKFMQTRGEKKYYITFIDYYTIYYYTYFLRSKDDTLEMFKHYKI